MYRNPQSVVKEVANLGRLAEERWFAGAGDTRGGSPAVGSGDWVALVRELAEGPVGALRLERGPALATLLPQPGAVETVASLDQTNALVVLGGRLLVKAYRRPFAGVHPEVEVLAALAETDAPVPAFAGAIVHGDTTLALLQEHVEGAESGWEPPILRLVAGDRATDRFARAGRATAARHRALRRAFGDGEAPHVPDAPVDAVLAAEPALAPHRAAVRVAPPARASQRLHGDLHIGQFVFAGDDALVVDFEGAPLAAPEDRRRPGSTLQDVASLLRSVDHVGRAASRRTRWDPTAWIAEARETTLAAYEAELGVTVDRDALRDFEILSDLMTLHYAHQVLPEWAYAPRASLLALLGDAEGAAAAVEAARTP